MRSAFIRVLPLIVGLGLVNPEEVCAQPIQRVVHQTSVSGTVVRHVETTQKRVALTFDDGPNRIYTPQILRLLDEYHARATFFVIGKRVDMYPHLVEEESKRGEVANHSFHHVVLQGRSPRQISLELDATEKAILSITENGAKLVRPPRGRFDTGFLRVASNNGYKVILWSLDSRDWAHPGTGAIIRRVLRDVSPGDILLFHDGGGTRTQTVQALSAILPALEHRGYSFVTVSSLLNSGIDKDK